MRKIIAALAVFVFAMLPVPSFAECVCKTSVSDSEKTVGRIIHSKGEVFYSGKFGYSDAIARFETIFLVTSFHRI